MDNFRAAHSEITDVAAAVSSIKEQLSGVDACLVLYFVSTSYPANEISKEMATAFAGARTVGCTTAGEIVSGKIGQNSIVAMAWGKETMKFLKVEVLENIKTDDEAVEKALKSFEVSLGKTLKDLDTTQYVGMILIDGMSGCEEILNDQLGNKTNVVFLGGSAGDDFKFQQTNLFVDGKAYSEAAILLLMEPTNGFITLKTQSFIPTCKKLTPTKVDEERRMVIEFNGKPATVAYAEVLGITEAELVKNLGEFPLGLVFDEQNFFVRSPQKVEGTCIYFYCAIKEGLDMTILQSGDIIEETRCDLQKCGSTSAIIDFNCCLRVLELTRKNLLKDYSLVYGDTPAIGFSTYGESYIGHINQTSTMLLLK